MFCCFDCRLFFAVQQAGADLLFDQGMIARQRLEAVLVPEVGAAVAHVRDAGQALVDQRRHDCRAHVGLAGILLGLAENGVVRAADRIRQDARLRLVALVGVRHVNGSGPVHLLENGVHREPAGDFPRGGSPHAVADDEQALRGAHGEGVFVVSTDPPRVCRRSDIEPHGYA
jgi:hypothetical protein